MREDSSSKMDKKSAIRRAKRQAKVEENYWDCSVCTYRNTAEAFKCLMCDVRKGTSTRKPRINPAMAAQQAGNSASGAANGVPERRKSESRRGRLNRLQRKRPRRPPRLTDVDRSSAQTREVTVNSVTVIITEYKPKKSPLSLSSGEPDSGERA